MMRCTPPIEWLEAGHTKLMCAECGWDLRPQVTGRESPQTPKRLRLYCGQCCNDGLDEIERGRSTVWCTSVGFWVSSPSRHAKKD